MPQTTSKPISHQDKIAWLRLFRSQNVSQQTFFRLLTIFGNVNDALKNIADYSIKGGRNKPITVCPLEKAELEVEKCTKIGAEIIILDDPRYPKLLKEIADPPPLITVLGNIDLLAKPILSIVGSRNSSYNGCKFATMIAGDLGKKGFVITSGLARGIDSAAHLGSIATGTIAVIAGGIDNIYPKENKKLYYDIANQGLIISEMPFGFAPYGGHFPQRNRIISGVALGVVVVEAVIRSGTLITARCALEQNREVFAVPGSPFDPRCHGSNNLIRQGAALIEKADDILADIKSPEILSDNNKMMETEQADFAGFSTKINNADNIDTASALEIILSQIGYEPISLDEILSRLQIPVRIFNAAITQLELADKIEHKNGKICLKFSD